MSASPKPRMVWFDANRVCAAMGVVLIHSTTDFSGSAFPKVTPDERLVPVILRSIAEFSGSEMFFTFSLFLIAMKLDRRRLEYRPAIAEQARRLLVPFAVWTLFYIFFRLVKADAFHYGDHIRDEIGVWQNWLGYFLLGEAQYHMHFLPTLFLLFLFYPVMKLAMRYPILGLSLFATLGVMHYVQGFIWGLPVTDLVRDGLIRATKVLGYVGYGMAAFALYGLWKDGIPRGESHLIRRGALFFALTAYVATLPFYGSALMSGTWGARDGWSFYGHFLMPLFMFCLFMGLQYGEWSPRWSRLARYTFGVYLAHPMMVDLYDVAVYRSGLDLSPAALVILRFAVVLPVTFGFVVLLSRLKATAWTIGLGPAPWEWRRAGASAASGE
ncbi:acyltransferase [Neotabrizicola sp. VNH66]|uniref:acyltransferase n=1 Tax=Neotabrizicola sp. VNH66 TaxID=3400918 RepID=UPI003C04E60B